jgi:hypothetical protein
MHVIAGKAVCLGEAGTQRFRAYAQAIVENARVLAEALRQGGLSLVSGGTDNHLLLVDVTPLKIGGKMAEKALEACGITVNKNMIPYDTRKPVDPGVGFERNEANRQVDVAGPGPSDRRRLPPDHSTGSAGSLFPLPGARKYSWRKQPVAF